MLLNIDLLVIGALGLSIKGFTAKAPSAYVCIRLDGVSWRTKTVKRKTDPTWDETINL